MTITRGDLVAGIVTLFAALAATPSLAQEHAPLPLPDARIVSQPTVVA